MEFADIYRCLAGDGSDIWEIGFQTSADDEPLALASLDGNFSCTLSVPASGITRAITDKNVANNRFRASMTAAETATLGPGDHIVHLKITNATLNPALARTKQLLLRIS